MKTDLHARVLSTNDVPIPGLWAAGEMTGLFYNEYPPATSCLRSMTFGRLAGAEIADKVVSDEYTDAEPNEKKTEKSDSFLVLSGKDADEKHDNRV